MIRFFKKHTTLSWLLIISIGIVIFYLATLDVPEAFRHAGDFLIVLETLALSYIASFIFYILQVYIPEERKSKKINKDILVYTNQIIYEINETLEVLVKKKRPIDLLKNTYSQEQFKDLFVFNAEMKVSIIDPLSIKVDKSGHTKMEEITARIWILQQNHKIESIMDRAIRYYGGYMNEELLKAFEKIHKTGMMSYIKDLLQIRADIAFNTSNNGFCYEFYKVGEELQQVADKELR